MLTLHELKSLAPNGSEMEEHLRECGFVLVLDTIVVAMPDGEYLFFEALSGDHYLEDKPMFPEEYCFGEHWGCGRKALSALFEFSENAGPNLSRAIRFMYENTVRPEDITPELAMNWLTQTPFMDDESFLFLVGIVRDALLQGKFSLSDDDIQWLSRRCVEIGSDFTFY